MRVTRGWVRRVLATLTWFGCARVGFAVRPLAAGGAPSGRRTYVLSLRERWARDVSEYGRVRRRSAGARDSHAVWLCPSGIRRAAFGRGRRPFGASNPRAFATRKVGSGRIGIRTCATAFGGCSRLSRGLVVPEWDSPCGLWPRAAPLRGVDPTCFRYAKGGYRIPRRSAVARDSASRGLVVPGWDSPCGLWPRAAPLRGVKPTCFRFAKGGFESHQDELG